MATNAELLALFGDDFQDVLAGLQNLPAEARELLDRSMAKMLFDAEVFGSRVNKAVQGQRIAGISDDLIKAGLLEDMQNGGRVFGEIRNQVKGSLVEGINQSSRAGTFQALDPEADTLFTWITVAGHKICQDCAPRGGQRKTLKEWEELGLPASGWSVCRGYCYCILDPSGKISPRLEMEGVVEKGATIRKKPAPAAPKEMAWKPSMTTKEAVEWNKDSKVQGVTYHGTTELGAQGIRKDGFDLSKGRTGKLYGNGAYTTKSEKEVASAFAQKDGVVIKTMVKAEKPFTVEMDDFSQMIMGNVPVDFIDDSMGKLFPYKIWKGYEKHQTAAKKRVYSRYFNKNKDNIYRPPNTPKPSLDNQFPKRYVTIMDEDYKDWLKKTSKADRKKFDEMMDMGDRWYEWLDKEYQKGNKEVIAWLEKDYNITQSSDVFPDAFRQFLIDEGYDSLIVKNVYNPFHPEVLDDYFIMLKKENIVAISD